MRTNRNLLHVANAIRDRLLDARREPLALPAFHADEIVRLMRRLERATDRRWTGAAVRLRHRLHMVVANHRARVEDLHAALAASHPRVPTLSAIHADLCGVAEDFEGVHYDRRTRTLVVRTESIELSGVFLGSFDVKLRLDDWWRPPPYDIVAVDPHAAGSSSRVTHPHVDGEMLCEGEGRMAIRRALDGGRIHDFFVLVDRILHTYNAASAYVPLTDWDGVACADCGVTVDDDERYDCVRCRCDLCGDCSPCCDGCGEAHCFDCLDRCADCDERFCSHCLRRCRDCGEDFCEEHLDDEQCHACRDRLAENEKEPPAVAADAVRDSEVAVPT